MPASRSLRTLSAWVAVMLLAAGAVSPAFAALPLGQWRISAVHVDAQRTSRMVILPNDHVLVGQRLSSTVGRLALTGEDGQDCQTPSATQQVSSLGRLIADTMGARPDGAPEATPADYGLAAPEGAITVHWIACRIGHFGPSDFSGHPDTWLVQVDGALLVGWSDHTVLAALPVSQVAQGAATPGPSFDCARASTATEGAICRSADLSADDRSVAAAYANAQYWCDKDPDKLALLAKVQKAWRAQRDACVSDATCLAKSMSDQTAKLGQPSSFLGD